MKSLIKKLFYAEIENFPTEMQSISEREYAAYERMWKLFKDEQKEAFNEFEELYSARSAQNEEAAYVMGFKSGVLLAFELIDLPFSKKQ